MVVRAAPKAATVDAANLMRDSLVIGATTSAMILMFLGVSLGTSIGGLIAWSLAGVLIGLAMVFVEKG